MRRRRTHQVRAMDASRLITRTIHAQVSPKQEYSLNAHDRSLETVIDARKIRVDLYAEAPVPTHTAA
ncbi:winged helix-turn-helix transcriptional regulator [Methylobacterium sp. J-030]|nr:winged helix-turn-helix transcriptional regulator [Methylobacterium sp. J-030]